MNFGGHFLTGWLISKSANFSLPERRFITIAAIIPDIDAFSLAAPSILGDWHRTFGHNIFFGAAFPFLCFLFFNPRRGIKILPFAFSAMLSHFVLDILVTGWWALYPLWPIDKNYTILMSFYIPENIMKYHIQMGLLAVLVIIMLLIYRKSRRTPLEIISPQFEKFMINFVTTPFNHKCAVCGSRAFYICENTKQPLCGRHVKITKSFSTFRKM